MNITKEYGGIEQIPGKQRNIKDSLVNYRENEFPNEVSYFYLSFKETI